MGAFIEQGTTTLEETINYNKTEHISNYAIAAIVENTGDFKTSPTFIIDPKDLEQYNWITNYEFKNHKKDEEQVYKVLKLNLDENESEEDRTALLNIKYDTVDTKTNSIKYKLTQSHKEINVYIRNCKYVIYAYRKYIFMRIYLNIENNLNTWYTTWDGSETITPKSEYIDKLNEIDTTNYSEHNKFIYLQNNNNQFKLGKGTETIGTEGTDTDFHKYDFKLDDHNIIYSDNNKPLNLGESFKSYNFNFKFANNEYYDFSNIYIKTRINNYTTDFINDKTDCINFKFNDVNNKDQLLYHLNLQFINMFTPENGTDSQQIAARTLFASKHNDIFYIRYQLKIRIIGTGRHKETGRNDKGFDEEGDAYMYLIYKNLGNNQYKYPVNINDEIKYNNFIIYSNVIKNYNDWLYSYIPWDRQIIITTVKKIVPMVFVNNYESNELNDDMNNKFYINIVDNID